MSADQPQAKSVCDHSWISTHQPDFPVYWIRQCSNCLLFDADSMREEIAKAAAALAEPVVEPTEASRTKFPCCDHCTHPGYRGHAFECMRGCNPCAATPSPTPAPTPQDYADDIERMDRALSPEPAPTCDRPGAAHRGAKGGGVEHSMGNAINQRGRWEPCPAETALTALTCDPPYFRCACGISEYHEGHIQEEPLAAPTGPTEAHQHEIRFVIDCAACIQELSDDLDRRSTTHRDNEGGAEA